MERLQARLKKQKVQRNPRGLTSPFPENYLSYSCAAWAVRSSLPSTTEFCRLLGCGSPLAGLTYMAT